MVCCSFNLKWQKNEENCAAKIGKKKKKKQISRKKSSYWNPLSNSICGESSDLESNEGSKKLPMLSSSISSSCPIFPAHTHVCARIASPINGHIISKNRFERGNNVRFDGVHFLFITKLNLICFVCNCLSLFFLLVCEWLCLGYAMIWYIQIALPFGHRIQFFYSDHTQAHTHANDHKLCKIIYLIDKTIQFRFDPLICARALIAVPLIWPIAS